MSDAEWLASNDLLAMLAFARGRVGRRKLDLFACASHRRDWFVRQDEECRRAVEVFERHIEGQAGPGAWERAARVLNGLPSPTWSEELGAAMVRDRRIVGNPFRRPELGGAATSPIEVLHQTGEARGAKS
jgi:hypothetical protein